MITRESTVQDIVSSNPLMELVLDRFDISIRPEGISIREKCEEGQLDTDFLLEILRAYDDPSTFNEDVFRRFSLGSIIDYLKRTHSFYLNRRIPEIEQSMDALLQRYNEAYPLLYLFPRYFSEYAFELAGHIQEEEVEVFSLADQLLRRPETVLPAQMEYAAHHHAHHQEHNLSQDLVLLRKILERHCPEVLNVLPFKILLTQLASFERDLTIHEWIEDRVMWPSMLNLAGKGRA